MQSQQAAKEREDWTLRWELLTRSRRRRRQPPAPIHEQAPPEHGFTLTLSVGAVLYQPEKGDLQDANWLIDRADRAMYEAKRAGGDQVRLDRLDAGLLAHSAS